LRDGTSQHRFARADGHHTSWAFTPTAFDISNTMSRNAGTGDGILLLGLTVRRDMPTSVFATAINIPKLIRGALDETAPCSTSGTM
jgi:hypothetical protein